MDTNIFENLNIMIENQVVLNSSLIYIIILLSFISGLILMLNLTLKYDWFK
jgi:hypothetical protein